ncbi:uncharacterized protein LAESUDRAFT_762905 [Laetiporus sulphureus 93-53]|uniref:Uncharacterized protein n=1 Tax=Laetiporus sulphureus 93-53 TaxID=1314785 RepID=A0A165C7G9_9APHY|nr:uncharacterized protein LAESUDRAFT_762905 [Laetiporus sulphureus 93-53]KZT02335.1 hypothetical protein LAESUDRAFT_762905 [Laetiporus sulphureus 93-53]
MLQDQISEAFCNQKVKQLGARRTIADLKLLKQETLLVQVPDDMQSKRKMTK